MLKSYSVANGLKEEDLIEAELLNKMEDNRTQYERNVQERSLLKYYIGLYARWKQHFKYAKAVRIARKKGAQIGEGVIMPLSFAKKCNSNVTIGAHTSIATDRLDTRCPLHIGSHVIIGSNVEIITASHNINSPEWEYKPYGLSIGDYVWIAQNGLILPSCRNIARGAVVGAGAVVVRNVEEMSVVSGNPAKEIKKRTVVHEALVVESCLGGDYQIYKQVRSNK